MDFCWENIHLTKRRGIDVCGGDIERVCWDVSKTFLKSNRMRLHYKWESNRPRHYAYNLTWVYYRAGGIRIRISPHKWSWWGSSPMGPDGPLANPPWTRTARFYQWLCSARFARHSWQEQEDKPHYKVEVWQSGLHPAEPFVEACRLHPWWIGEWTVQPHGTGSSLMPPVQRYLYLYTNTPISNHYCHRYREEIAKITDFLSSHC